MSIYKIHPAMQGWISKNRQVCPTDSFGEDLPESCNDTTPKRLTPFLPLLKKGGELSSCSNYLCITSDAETIHHGEQGYKK